MELIVNGIARTVAEGSDIAGLLRALELSGARLVVERNGAIVKPEAYAGARLCHRDKIEIVRLVGGG